MNTQRRSDELIEKELKAIELVLKNTLQVELTPATMHSFVSEMVERKVKEYIEARLESWHCADLVELIGKIEDKLPGTEEATEQEPKKRGRPKKTSMN